MIDSFGFSLPIGRWHPFLPAMLQSLRLQTRPVRLALLDASGDPRVTGAADASGLDFAYRRHGPDAGQSAAIAEGWARLETDALGWLNADDLLMPDALSRAAAAFEADPDVDVVHGESAILDGAGATIGLHGQTGAVGPDLLRSNCISQPSCFVRRAAIEAVGGVDASLHYTMDWDLWVRLYRNGAVFRRLDAALSAVCWEVGTKTSELSPRRLREIGSLAARHAGPVNAAKTLAGLVAHHSPPGSVARRVLSGRRGWRAESGRETAETGLRLSAAREPGEPGRLEARLPVLNASLEPVRALEAVFEGAPVQITVEGADIASVRPGAWRISWPKGDGIAPGGAAMLTIAAREGASRLVRVGPAGL